MRRQRREGEEEAMRLGVWLQNKGVRERGPRRERDQFDTNRERLIWEGEKEREIDPFEGEGRGGRARNKDQGSRNKAAADLLFPG